MRETIEIGVAPFGEKAARVDSCVNGYEYRARAVRECAVLIRQLRRHAADHGVSIERVSLYVNSSTGPSGSVTYFVSAAFDTSDEEAMEAAYWLECSIPEFWDDAARHELGLPPIRVAS
jgi:pyrroloquinoline quinone (PQQ) biosynthesis protein C